MNIRSSNTLLVDANENRENVDKKPKKDICNVKNILTLIAIIIIILAVSIIPSLLITGLIGYITSALTRM